MKCCEQGVNRWYSYLSTITAIEIFFTDTMIEMLSVRVLPLGLLLLILAITKDSHQYYDPTMRDYVETCDEMAQLAGDNFCRVILEGWFAWKTD